jgi:acetylornithine/N-succinyldiaminopimelate aminotransferase
MTLSTIPTSTDALLGNYKRAPMQLVDGQGVYLIDADGKRYLDFVSGIAVNALGYADPGLRQAMHAAADGLIHVSNLYATEPGERLAASLVDKSFADRVFFQFRRGSERGRVQVCAPLGAHARRCEA